MPINGNQIIYADEILFKIIFMLKQRVNHMFLSNINVEDKTEGYALSYSFAHLTNFNCSCALPEVICISMIMCTIFLFQHLFNTYVTLKLPFLHLLLLLPPSSRSVTFVQKTLLLCIMLRTNTPPPQCATVPVQNGTLK